jgi:quercetin dioxygenase-like cupin family protein
MQARSLEDCAMIRSIVALAALPGTAAAAAERPLAIAPGQATLAWGACPPILGKGCEIAVLHGNPAEPNADIFLRLAPGTRLPAHWHSSAERMMLSTGQLRVEYAGEPASTLKPGDYAYGPAKHVHAATCVSKAACTLFIAFEGPVDAHPASTPR